MSCLALPRICLVLSDLFSAFSSVLPSNFESPNGTNSPVFPFSITSWTGLVSLPITSAPQLIASRRLQLSTNG